MVWVVGVIGIAALLVITALGRLIAATFVRLGRARAAGLDEAAGAAGTRRSVVSLIQDRDVVVGPAVVLSTAAQVAVLALVAITAANRGGWLAVLLALVGAGLVLALVEGIVRRWAVEANDRMAHWLVRPALALKRVWPLGFTARFLSWLARRLGPGASAEDSPELAEPELLALAAQAAEENLIEHHEATLIDSIITLGDTLVRAVMVPRPDMKTIPSTATVAEALRIVLGTGYTRLPVIGEDVDDVLGVAHAKDLMSHQLAGEENLPCSQVMRKAMFVPETKLVMPLMKEMQEAQTHLAVAVDEYGGTAGLVSLEDIIEELVGEIVDEFDDDEPLFEEGDDGTIFMSGRMSVAMAADLLKIKQPEGEWETLGGLVLEFAGEVPALGTVVDINEAKVVVREVEGRRIKSVSGTPARAESSA